MLQNLKTFARPANLWHCLSDERTVLIQDQRRKVADIDPHVRNIRRSLLILHSAILCRPAVTLDLATHAENMELMTHRIKAVLGANLIPQFLQAI